VAGSGGSSGRPSSSNSLTLTTCGTGRSPSNQRRIVRSSRTRMSVANRRAERPDCAIARLRSSMSLGNPGDLGRRQAWHAREVGKGNLVEQASVLGEANYGLVQDAPLDRARPIPLCTPRQRARPRASWWGAVSVEMRVEPGAKLSASCENCSVLLCGSSKRTYGRVHGVTTLVHEVPLCLPGRNCPQQREG
jgi:hypothetical protein